MLEVYNISWRNTEKTAVALGYFDGVHIAHQALISQMCGYAAANNLEKAVFTFTKSVPLGHKGKDILTKGIKLDVMRNMGIDLYYSPDFLDFSSLTPEEFVKNILVDSMGAKAVFCGENFFFGKNRQGNVQVLKELCEKYNIAFTQADTVCLDGEIVSSTAIRDALTQGDMEKASAMLGRPYGVNFEVLHGKKIGRTIGTPTINQIYPATMCSPKPGVYITCTTVDGKKYPSATGLTNRPTVNGTGYTCETFILGFEGDLYSQNVQVDFHSFLFEARKFDSLQQLGDMIYSSAVKAKEYLEEKGIIDC
ncbi:MAG: riboflavin biosynthesis protein RibF [Ruminococcaceae bacterium]|nr:riboflavin biosynthesis protein RibF [Oscillospiraceae bacterium]